MANNPELLKMPLARDGQKSTIPETTDASTGLFSQQYGWQSINSLPPQAGGKAVKREDFNGAFNLLGGIAYYAQKGFTFKWSADQDYYARCVVIDDTDGLRYECISDVTANNTAPSADATHWQIFSAGTDIDAWFRQASTVYANGAIALLLTLPTGWYLECTGTGGTTSASDLVITSPAIGNTVTDGTVTWTIRAVASTADIPAPVDISGKADITGANMVYHKDIITTSGTYTAPVTGLYKITIKGGGGGGGAGLHTSNSNSGGGGGGEGGTTIKYVMMTAGNTANVVIGAGGSGGTTSNHIGTDGGNSTVTIGVNTYTGGGGGAGREYSPGVGGSGTVNGCAGGSGGHIPSSLTITGGSGGGAGGGAIVSASEGSAGVYGGGGGGGSCAQSAGRAGGAGGNGYVWFEYYTPGA
jgi:hypothetical protein